jgi:hypothetical protein
VKGLRITAILYGLAIAAHTADHFRRGIDAITPEVFWSGIAATVLAAVAIGLALAANRYAAPVAAFVGLTHAIGIAAVHLLPRWSAFSDAFPGNGVAPISWVVVSLEIVASLAFGIAGVRALSSGPRGETVLPARRDVRC